MLRQIFSSDLPTIRHHIQHYSHGASPRVVARIAGWPGTFQVYDVREAHTSSFPEPQVWPPDWAFPLLSTAKKRIEVQIREIGDQDWHVAQALYLLIEET